MYQKSKPADNKKGMVMNMEFQYFLPVNLIFGCKKVNMLGNEAAKYGKKAFLVTGTSSTKKTGLLDMAVRLLEQAAVESVVFDKVTPNPVSDTVYEGVKLLKEHKCDMVVALGGGSIIDCAKAIAFSVCNEGDIFEYIYGLKTGSHSLPIISVPTTCGTGSEGNCFAVLTNPETKDKKSLRNMASISKVSIVDPELMTSMPDHVASSVMFDALCHNMEAYLSKITQPLVEMQGLYGVRLLCKNMVKAYKDHSDMEAWSAVALASTLGGMCINMTGVTAPHGMEHPASGLKNIVHGRGLAALAPVIYRESIEMDPEKFAVLSQQLGGRGAGDFVENLEYLLYEMDLKTSLSKEGIKEEDVEWMTENCLKVSAPSMSAHPKVFSKEEIKELYLKAL